MRKRKRKAPDDANVEMSPLIDCVFLLLIFFLVTTMMKKLEKQIPVTVPDNSVAVAERVESQREIIGISEKGEYFRSDGRQKDGRPRFVAVPDIDRHISDLAARAAKEPNGVNVRLYADAGVEFQRVIDLLDKLKIKDLSKVDVRMRDHDTPNWYVPGRKDEDEAE
ncbi:MAG: biopolymer transporter ExbD [Planctomycetes bacterium]|nr:biopolymer transporter ExbD [Planctomycetota bacterium]